MSSELLNALENRVATAVDTIEELRSEVRVLREERQQLENKLRDLLGRIERVDNGAAAAQPETSPQQTSEAPEAPFGRPDIGFGSGGSEY